MKTKIIVITGGVYSSLGKGIVASSIGCILKHGGFNLSMLKLDPYLNTDPGLLSPLQHGEVFITQDGQKADLDLGHYERFTGLNLSDASTTTSGKLYTELLEDEKNEKFNGATIQIVPHFTNKIIEKINYAIEKNNFPDFLVIEIGGTVGDIESLPFIEALRIYHARNNNVLFIHCSPLFQLSANDELKTKPTQHSIKNLRNLGIVPHILILRYKELISDNDKNKLSWTCDVLGNNIFVSKDCEYLYEVPKILYDQGIANSIMNYFHIENSKFDMKNWDKFLDSIYKQKNKTINICICGKYTELNDSYLSLIESLKLACYKNDVNLNLSLVDSTSLDSKNYETKLSKFDGFIVPDGSGESGVAQMQYVVKYCDQKNKPYLGIKLGMQVLLEYLNNGNKENLWETLPNKEYMLGNKAIKINKNSNVYKIYNNESIHERHWNNWIINTKTIDKFQTQLLVSGTGSNGEVEIIELKNHKFFIATLFHPEFISKPHSLHPLFDSFIKSII